MIKDYFKLASGNLRHRGLRSWLTILGIFIGIAAVVSLISLGQGLKEAITGQFSTLSTDMLTVQNSGTGFGPPGSTVAVKLNQHDIDVIKKVYGIEEIIPRLIRIATLEFNKRIAYQYIASMPEDQKQLDIIYKSFDFTTTDGRILKADDKGKVLIGSNTGLKDSFDKDIQVGDKIKIQGKEFQVIGRLKASSSFQINNAMMMMETDIKEILDIKDEIDLIVVKIKDINEAKTISEEIKKELRKDRNQKEGEEDFSVQTPLEAISSINNILNVVNVVIAGIACISLLIGGIGIANTMYTSVLERTKEIGTMKAIGAKNSDIMKIFLIESGFLGLVGGIIGASIGLGFAFLVSFIANSALGSVILEVKISYPLILASIMFAFLIGILSGIIPAIQASKLNPVEALRA